MLMVPSPQATSCYSVFFSQLSCFCPIYHVPYLFCLAVSIAIPGNVKSSGKGTLDASRRELHTSRDLSTPAERQLSLSDHCLLVAAVRSHVTAQELGLWALQSRRGNI